MPKSRCSDNEEEAAGDGKREDERRPERPQPSHQLPTVLPAAQDSQHKKDDQPVTQLVGRHRMRTAKADEVKTMRGRETSSAATMHSPRAPCGEPGCNLHATRIHDRPEEQDRWCQCCQRADEHRPTVVAHQEVEPQCDQERIEQHSEEPHAVERPRPCREQRRAAHYQVIERRVVGKLRGARDGARR